MLVGQKHKIKIDRKKYTSILLTALINIVALALGHRKLYHTIYPIITNHIKHIQCVSRPNATYDCTANGIEWDWEENSSVHVSTPQSMDLRWLSVCDAILAYWTGQKRIEYLFVCLFVCRSVYLSRIIIVFTHSPFIFVLVFILNIFVFPPQILFTTDF